MVTVPKHTFDRHGLYLELEQSSVVASEAVKSGAFLLPQPSPLPRSPHHTHSHPSIGYFAVLPPCERPHHHHHNRPFPALLSLPPGVQNRVGLDADRAGELRYAAMAAHGTAAVLPKPAVPVTKAPKAIAGFK